MKTKLLSLTFPVRFGGAQDIVLKLEQQPDKTWKGRMVKSLLMTRFLDVPSVQRFNQDIDMIESLILVHACYGVDVEAPSYIEGIRCLYEMASARVDS